MRKKPYKKIKGQSSLFAVLAGAVVVSASLCALCIWSAKHQYTPDETGDDSDMYAAATDDRLGVESEPHGTDDENSESASSVTVTEEPTDTETVTGDLTVPEPTYPTCPTEIESFLQMDADTPEYALAELLLYGVPSVVHRVERETQATDITGVSDSSEILEGTAHTQDETQTPDGGTSFEPPHSEPEYTETPGTVAIYYKDLTDGETLVFAKDKKHYAASMIKAVYIYALLRSAEKGIICTDDEFVYDSSLYVEGTGIFKNVEDGRVFSFFELAELVICQSDNTAYAMLRNAYGTQIFSDIMKEDGITEKYSAWWTTTASQYGAFFEKLYLYFASDSENAKWLCDCMCRSMQYVMLRNAFRPEKVAHKYGWDVDSYCDGAVVLNPEHPYVVVFMSNMDEGHVKPANTEFIYKIGELIKTIHDKKYGDGDD